MEKTAVIAGNGPSLGQIDYRRLPEKYDVFRCNRFAVEDKYYLGKDIHFLSIGMGLRYDTFLFTQAYEKKGFYCLNEVSCSGYSAIKIMEKYYPEYIYKSITNTVLGVNEFIKEYRQKHYISKGLDLWYNTGTCLLIDAVLRGYKEIYFVGVDLDFDNWTYAYPESSGSVSQEMLLKNHDLEFDKAIFEFVKTIPDINVYSIVENSVLSKIFPLAPIQNENPYIPEEKIGKEEMYKYANSYVTEKRVPLDEYRILLTKEEERKGYTQKIKQKFINNGLSVEWDFLRKNYLIQLVYQTIKIPYIFYKIIIKIYLHKK